MLETIAEERKRNGVPLMIPTLCRCASASQRAIVPKQELDRARTPIEDVVVGTDDVGEIVGNARGGPGSRHADDRVVEVVLVAREQVELEPWASRACRRGHRGPVAARQVADGWLDAS